MKRNLNKGDRIMSERKEVILIGAGKIGRGMSVQTFREAGYHIVFFCHHLEQAKALREQGYYTNFMVDSKGNFSEEVIDDYEAYATIGEYDYCVERLSKAKLAMAQLYPNAFQSVGELVGDTVKKRAADGIDYPLDVLIGVNANGADKVIYKAALERLNTPEEKEYLDKKIGLSIAIPMTLGADPSPEMLAKDPLANYCGKVERQLQFDLDALKGPAPEGKFLLPLHKMAERMIYKLWTSNLRHCGFGFLTDHKGYTDTYDAKDDMEVQQGAIAGLDESMYGFFHTYDLTPAEIAEATPGQPEGDNRNRQKSAAHDSIRRICRDPIRKLGRTERFTGPAIACMKAGKIPFFITRIMACVMDYKDDNDPKAVEIQEFIKENGVEKAIVKFCELNMDDPDEKRVMELVASHYHLMKLTDPDDIRID